ncbi:MAG: sigma-70 family RNA polymerase sigma factor [Candidatus Eremiobacteraeota bacterium]|nr:sigma-70 family RNA polymerase sigma factor [Candidatus Eremiobacteraeota bacterium]
MMRKALRFISEPAQDNDQQLLARSLAGEERAFELLVRRYQKRLFAVAVKMVKDRDLASELVQESFFKAYKSLQSHSGGSVKSWLTRITVNTCLNEIRKRQRLIFGEHSMENWLTADKSSDPAHSAQAGELRQAVKEQVLQLSPRRQAVLALAALGYSYEEMAESLEESVAQVKSELFRARKTLRETLKEYRS